MAYRKTKLGLLVQLDETKAKKEIMKAFKKGELVTSKAAEILDVSVSGLKGYVVKLGLTAEIDELRSKAKRNFPSYDREKSKALQVEAVKKRQAKKAEEEKTAKKAAKKGRTRRSAKKSSAAA